MHSLDMHGISGEEELIGEGTTYSRIICEFIFNNNTNMQTMTRLLSEIPQRIAANQSIANCQ